MAKDRPDVSRRRRRIFAKLRRHVAEDRLEAEKPARVPPPERADDNSEEAPGPDTETSLEEVESPPALPDESAQAVASPPPPDGHQAVGLAPDLVVEAEKLAVEPEKLAVEPEKQAVVVEKAADAPAEQAMAVKGESDLPGLPSVVAIANQKGGVGKTTTAINLGAALAELNYRVLVVDLDPQGNATTGLGIHARDLEHSIYDALMTDTPIEDCVESTSVKNLFLVPATIDLSGAEIELVPAFSRELKLRRALEEITADYDFTLIDCPPSLGLLTINGLAAADDVIVPIQCEYYALEGLGQLLRNIALVKGSLNPTLDVRGIVLTMYDGRTRLAEQVEKDVREHFGPKVYDTVIPRTIRLGEAPSFGQPIIVFDPTSRGAETYRELAKEVSDGTSGRAG